MLLLVDEREAITNFVMDFNQNSFAVFLAQAGCPPLATFAADTLPMPVIAMNFNEWLDKNNQYLVPMLKTAVQRYPAHPCAPVLQDTATRLENAARASDRVKPWDACLASGVPVVNRASLRAVLKNIADGQDRPITLVDGPSGAGRSHSWHLIQHVAKSIPDLSAVKVDLNAYVAEQQTIANVFGQLTRKLQLNVTAPTTTGATPATNAARHAEEIVEAYANAPGAARAWVVFDSLDRPVPPEIKLFVCALAHHKLDHQLGPMTFFLLGAGRNFGIDDPYLLMELETLTSFLEPDVAKAAELVNQQGTRPLDAVKLRARVDGLREALALPDIREACKAVATRLVQLRVEVGA